MPTAQCVYKLGTSFVLFLEEEYILDYSMNSFNKKKRFSVFTVFRISAHTCIMQIVQKKKNVQIQKVLCHELTLLAQQQDIFGPRNSNRRVDPVASSLRGRRSKGKGKGIRARDRARGRRDEGNPCKQALFAIPPTN